MKRLFVTALLALSSAAFSATLAPIQMLSPTGSSSGQVITSTGPSTAPAWSTITLSGLGGLVAANNLSDLVSASTARTNLGLTSTATTAIGTSGATVPLLNGANTWSGAQVFSALITPASTIGIKGTTTNDSPAAGSVGENPTNSTTGTSLTTGANANATSVPLSAGDWDLECTATFSPAGSTTVTQIIAGVSTTSATFATANTGATVAYTLNFTTGQSQTIVTPVWTAKLASAGTGYCVVNAVFGVSTMTATGFIRARRPR